MTNGDHIDSPSGDSRFDRRSYLKGIAGAAALPLAASMGVGADEGDYEVVEVPANGTYTATLGSGDTLENVLIDITAPGARYRIRASGSGWAIRNVGVRGTWPTGEKLSPFIASVTDPNGEAHIENVYLGDRQSIATVRSRAPGSTDGVTGLFVPTSHAGTLHIDRVNIQSFGDNCIYASAPGNGPEHPAPGQGGRVIISNSFARETHAACFRIGTAGSRVENSVAIGGQNGQGSRAFWGYYEDTEIVDCDFSGSTLADVVVGANAWETGRRATVTATDSRFESTGGPGRVIGESEGTPQRTSPEEVEGCPTTAEEAASGTSSSSGSSPSVPEEDETEESEEELEEEQPEIEEIWKNDEANYLEFRGGSSDSVSEYRISGQGVAEAGEYANTNPDDPYRDTVTADGETFTVEGYLGGYLDDFYVEGSVADVTVDSDVVVAVNDYELEPADLEGIGSWDGDGEADDAEDEERSDEQEHTSTSLKDFFSDWDNIHICRWNR